MVKNEDLGREFTIKRAYTLLNCIIQKPLSKEKFEEMHEFKPLEFADYEQYQLRLELLGAITMRLLKDYEKTGQTSFYIPEKMSYYPDYARDIEDKIVDLDRVQGNHILLVGLKSLVSEATVKQNDYNKALGVFIKKTKGSAHFNNGVPDYDSEPIGSEEELTFYEINKYNGKNALSHAQMFNLDHPYKNKTEEKLNTKQAREILNNFAKKSLEKDEFLKLHKEDPTNFADYQEYVLRVKLNSSYINKNLDRIEKSQSESFYLPIDTDINDKKPAFHNLIELKLASEFAANHLSESSVRAPANLNKIDLDQLKIIAKDLHTLGQDSKAFNQLKDEYHFGDLYRKDLDEKLKNFNEKIALMKSFKIDGLEVPKEDYNWLLDKEQGSSIKKISFLNNQAFEKLNNSVPYMLMEKARENMRGIQTTR